MGKFLITTAVILGVVAWPLHNLCAQSDTAEYRIQDITLDSLEQLSSVVQQRVDQVYYIDVWGLSCPPCFAEFQKAKSKKAELSALNVEVIYVCMKTRDFNELRYRDIIQKYELDGIHLKLTAEATVQLLLQKSFDTPEGSVGLPLFYFWSKDEFFTAPKVSDFADFERQLKELKCLE